MGNIFNRTICFVKEKDKDGRTYLRRIPWDLINTNVVDGFCVSPMPVNGEFPLDTTPNEVVDMLIDESIDPIDKVTGIEFFASEQAFYARFGNAFGSYKTSSPEDEFGFPYTTGE